MPVSIGSITAANAVFTLTAAGLYTAPQQIQQFGVDDAFDSEAVENGEIVKGVDGFIAAGWLPTQPRLNVTLMANSPSQDLFDNIFQNEQAARDKILLQGLIIVPGISKKYTLINMYLFSFMHLAPAKKTLQPRKYGLILDDISVAPV